MAEAGRGASGTARGGAELQPVSAFPLPWVGAGRTCVQLSLRLLSCQSLCMCGFFVCVSVWVFVGGGFFFEIKKRRCVYFWQRQKRSADIFLPVLLNQFFSDTENNINIPVDKTL